MIPFCKTDLGEDEINAVAHVMRSGWVVLGKKSDEFEAAFAEYVGAKHAVFLDSCTSALFLALKWRYGDGGAIINTPALTFAATSEAIVHSGNTPRFQDVSMQDFCLEHVNDFSLPVSLTGNKAKSGALVYDSAHRIAKGDMIGETALFCYSFYATKNITTVQGGMIATNDTAAYEWLKQARDHGLDLGTKERYTQKYKQYDVSFVGWRMKGDDFRAACGIEQLKKLPALNARREEIVDRYNQAFGLKRTGNHLYPILVKHRPAFVEHLFNEGIQTAVHFRPLNTMTAYRQYPHGDLTNTTYIGERIVSLPLFPKLTDSEQDHIIKTVKETGSLLLQ